MSQNDSNKVDNKALITKRLQILDDIQQEINILKESLDTALENDSNYQEITEELQKIKEDRKVQNELVRDKVMEKPQIKSLKEQIKEKQQDVKDNKEILSQELAEYYRETGSLEITDAHGNTKRMKFNVKLVSE